MNFCAYGKRAVSLDFLFRPHFVLLNHYVYFHSFCARQGDLRLDLGFWVALTSTSRTVTPPMIAVIETKGLGNQVCAMQGGFGGEWLVNCPL